MLKAGVNQKGDAEVGGGYASALDLQRTRCKRGGPPCTFTFHKMALKALKARHGILGVLLWPLDHCAPSALSDSSARRCPGALPQPYTFRAFGAAVELRHAERLFIQTCSKYSAQTALLHSVVLLQRCDDAIARQAKDANAVCSGHCFRREHRVDDGFFCGIDGRSK